MNKVQEAILEAIEKMHNLMNDRTNMNEEDVKIDIAIANTTSQLAKAYVASAAMQYKIDNAEQANRVMLEETL